MTGLPGRGNNPAMRRLASLVLIVLMAGAPTHAEPAPKPAPAPSPDVLRERWMKAAGEQRFADAAQDLALYLTLCPEDAISRYNLVLIRLAMGDAAGAETALQEAVEWGFADIRRISRDPRLKPLHASKTYRGIIANWRKIQDGILNGRSERIRKELGPAYRVQREEPMRVAIISPLAQPSVDDARREMELVSAWWCDHVLPEGQPAAKVEGDQPEPWVVLLLPSEVDYERWAVKQFGERGRNIGGVYDHDRLELVAKDIGSTLRHEYAHVLHWRSMDRLGQVHPAWIQEGLCSLPEDVTLVAAEPAKGGAAGKPASIVPTASWRTNTVRRMANLGNLPSWSKLMKLPAEDFTASRVLGNYAAARSIFLYLAQAGKLRAWYAEYTTNYADDPSGAAAIARVMGQPIEQVERDWRVWARKLPEVAEPGRSSIPTLPFKVEAAGDGLRVAAQAARPDSALTRAGLRPGDMILAVGGQPVRDTQDLARLLGEKKPGDEVELACRRGATPLTARVRLGPRE